EKMLTLYPRVRILWAHAGMSSSAQTVSGLLGRFPNLWVELAIRTDVAPGGTLDPAWRTAFMTYPDRFMVGTDTWVTSRWEPLRETMQATQDWLAQLPRDVAEQIAYKNGERLFPAPHRPGGAPAGPPPRTPAEPGPGGGPPGPAPPTPSTPQTCP